MQSLLIVTSNAITQSCNLSITLSVIVDSDLHPKILLIMQSNDT